MRDNCECDASVVWRSMKDLNQKEINGKILLFAPTRETEQYAKREEVWQQIEELARKKNPQFENLINQMDYLSLSQNNNDFTLNEDDFSSDKIDQYSKDVSDPSKVSERNFV